MKNEEYREEGEGGMRWRDRIGDGGRGLRAGLNGGREEGGEKEATNKWRERVRGSTNSGWMCGNCMHGSISECKTKV